jgi:hypothetical protein
MPFSIVISTKDQICHLVASGVITVQLCTVTAEKLISHPNFLPHFGTVIDFRQATNTPMMNEMRELATMIFGIRDCLHGRIGLVVKDTDAKKASVMCMLVRVFGVKMESYGDTTKAFDYVRTGTGDFNF